MKIDDTCSEFLNSTMKEHFTESQNITIQLLPQLRNYAREQQLAMGRRFGVIVLKVKKIIFMEQLRIFFLSTK